MGDITIIQAILVFVVAFIMGIDQFSFLESLYQPIVTCPIIGAILGNFELGIVVGGAYQLIQICLLYTSGTGLKFPKWSRIYVTFILPLVVLFIFVQGYWSLLH